MPEAPPASVPSAESRAIAEGPQIEVEGPTVDAARRLLKRRARDQGLVVLSETVVSEGGAGRPAKISARVGTKTERIAAQAPARKEKERPFEADGFSFFRDNNGEWRWSRDVTGAEIALGAVARSFPFDSLAACISDARGHGYRGPDSAPEAPAVPDIGALEKRRDMEGLIRALQHQDDRTRCLAAAALRSLGDPRAVEPLLSALDDPVPSVRSCVTSALDWFRDPRAVEPLIARLKDEWAGPRSIAAAALGRLGDRRAVDPLIATLDDPDPAVRQNAASALGVLGDATARDALASAMEHREPQVFATAAEALAALGDGRAFDVLVRTLRRHDYWSQGAARALSTLGDGRAVEALGEALAALDSSVSREAALALARFGDGRGFDVIVAQLRHYDSSEAAAALGALGDPRGIEPLAAALKKRTTPQMHPDVRGRIERVREAAARALEAMGGPEAERILAEHERDAGPDG